MTTLARPDDEKAWRSYASSQLIAWKTGTSHGHRDAWAIGLNGSILVVVWVGNADGEGRAELTGIKAAAPLLHQIVRLSDYNPRWLEEQKPFMPRLGVCQVTGKLASEFCPTIETEVVQNAERSGLCKFHRSYTMDSDGQSRVNSDCYSLANSTQATRFVLPPLQSHFYRRWQHTYEGLPPLHPDCQGEKQNPLVIIYPTFGNKIFIPKDFDGVKGEIVLQASHQQEDAELYWHLDEHYVGQTKDVHDLVVQLDPGKHTLRVLDQSGNSRVQLFEVVGETR